MPRTSKVADRPSKNPSLRRFWERHIERWEQSSLSKVSYCQEHRLTYHQFIYWHKRLAASSAGELVSAPAEPFVQLAVSAPESPATLQLSLPNGLRIEGIDARSVALIGSLIAQL